MIPRLPRRTGLTITGVLVVVAILGFLITLLLPTLCRSSEGGNRVKCASNLRQIGLVIEMYARDNNGSLPRTTFDHSERPVPTFFTNPESPHPFHPGGPEANDVTAALFLLLRTQDVGRDVFLCPSSDGERGPADVAMHSNFTQPINLSYSYQNPYPSEPAAQHWSRILAQPADADFAIAADLNPGGAALLSIEWDSPRRRMASANSPNHAGDGQNVLYADGHVEFQNSPFSGTMGDVGGRKIRDNIYLAGGVGSGAPAVVNGAMADARDSILLPTSEAGPAIAGLSTTRVGGVRKIVWLWAGGAAAVAVTGVLAAVIVARRRRAAKAKTSPTVAAVG